MDARPQSIGPYRLLHVLGRGGMGVVYRAVHEDGRSVALKTVRLPAQVQLAGLRREVHALARLQHPGIVRILDEGISDGLPWYAMELLDGVPIDRYVAALGNSPNQGGQTDASSTGSGGPPSTGSGGAAQGEQKETAGPKAFPNDQLNHVLHLVRRVCEALAYLHGEGLVHRDLKPANVLVRPDGAPVIVDFGLAAVFSGDVSREALTTGGFTAGTFSGMAPEQIRGELVDARADLYALGCLLYGLLAGRPPFVDDLPVNVLWQHLRVGPEPLAKYVKNLPESLETLVLRLLEKDPRQRLGYADDVATVLASLVSDTRPRAHADEAGRAPKPRAYLYRPQIAGREGPLAKLEWHVQQLAMGHGALVFIGGESGIGKTRLLLELARRAEGKDFCVLSGESVRIDPRIHSGVPPMCGPLQPFRRTLQEVADRCRGKDSQETARLLGRHGKLLALYEPALNDLPGLERCPPPAELPTEAARLRLYTALAETLQSLAEARPLMLLLDDLQWADELTVGFLEFLAGPASSQIPAPAGMTKLPRVLIVGTYRAEEPGEALRRVLELGGSVRITLGRLDEPAVGQMVCDMLALSEPPATFARYLCRQSEGNPFFVAEYLRAALNEGLLWRDDAGRWQVAEQAEGNSPDETYDLLALPHSIRQLVARHLARLDGPASRLVEAAAVLGKDVEVPLLARVSGLGPAQMLEGTLELLRQRFMEEARRGSLRFVHDRLREVAYAQIDVSRRGELHRAAAEAFEALGTNLLSENRAVLGHHWEHAGVPARARGCFLAAARDARSRYAHAEAESLYRRYLALIEGPTPESVRIRTELGADVLEAQSKMDAAMAEYRQALSEARQIADRLAEAESLRSMGQVLRGKRQTGPARELFEAALGIVREGADLRLEGRVLGDLATCYYDQGQTEEALELFAEALELHRQIGDRRYEGLGLCNLAVCYKDLGRFEEARELFQQSMEIHRSIGNRRHEADAQGNLANSYSIQGRFEEARLHYEQALAIHREVGSRGMEGLVIGNLANLFHSEGRLAEAAELFERSLSILSEVGAHRYEGGMLGNLAAVYRDQGRLEEAEAVFERALAIHQASGDKRFEAGTLAELADLLRAHQPGRAEKLARHAEDLALEIGDKLELLRSVCVHGLVELARGSSALELLGWAERLAAEMVVEETGELGQKLSQLRRAQRSFEEKNA